MGVDDRHKKGRQGRQARKEAVQNMRQQTWLIVCEGKKTEPNYFKGLIESLNATSPHNPTT